MYTSVTEKQGTFGGGDHPLIPVTVKIVSFSIPDDCHVIGGKLYRMIYDPKVLQYIVYPDGTRPTACALIPVE